LPFPPEPDDPDPPSDPDPPEPEPPPEPPLEPPLEPDDPEPEPDEPLPLEPLPPPDPEEADPDPEDPDPAVEPVSAGAEPEDVPSSPFAPPESLSGAMPSGGLVVEPCEASPPLDEEPLRSTSVASAAEPDPEIIASTEARFSRADARAAAAGGDPAGPGTPARDISARVGTIASALVSSAETAERSPSGTSTKGRSGASAR
jgi:hypothetical protein